VKAVAVKVLYLRKTHIWILDKKGSYFFLFFKAALTGKIFDKGHKKKGKELVFVCSARDTGCA